LEAHKNETLASSILRKSKLLKI